MWKVAETERLAAEDAESAIVAGIRKDFNLTPVLSRAHFEQMARYFSEYGQLARREAGQRLGRPSDSAPSGKSGAVGEAASPRLVDYRRLARRNLPGLLRYKFLHEYGY